MICIYLISYQSDITYIYIYINYDGSLLFNNNSSPQGASMRSLGGEGRMHVHISPQGALMRSLGEAGQDARQQQSPGRFDAISGPINLPPRFNALMRSLGGAVQDARPQQSPGRPDAISGRGRAGRTSTAVLRALRCDL